MSANGSTVFKRAAKLKNFAGKSYFIPQNYKNRYQKRTYPFDSGFYLFSLIQNPAFTFPMLQRTGQGYPLRCGHPE